MIDEVGLKEKPEDTICINMKRYIQMRPEAPGVWQRTGFPTPNHYQALSGTADLGTGRFATPWGGGSLEG